MRIKAFTKKDLEITAQTIVNNLQQFETALEIEGLEANTISKLKQAALRYTMVLNNAGPKIQQFEQILRQIKQIYKNMPNTADGIKRAEKELKKYERSKSLFLSSRLAAMVLQETDVFQRSMFEALGTQLKTIYTFDGQIYDISNIPPEQIFKTAYSSRRKFTGVYNTSAIKNLINQNLLPTIAFDEQVRPVYAEALNRYKYTKQTGIFWHTLQRHFQKVQSQGSIEESFAYFGIAEQGRFQGIINKEEQIEIFVEEGIKQVDNISGRLQGDFRVGQIEFAAKSLGASMASLQQFKKLATLIVSDSFTDLKQLQAIKNKDASKGRKINAIASELTEDINQLIDNYFATI